MASVGKVWLSLLALLFLVGAAQAQPGVGLVKVSTGVVSIERGGKTLAAPVGTVVHAADVIHTGRDGRVGLTFLDNARMSLGPGSTLTIDRFVFDQTTHDGSFDTTLRRGTLSAISGKLAKQSPTAMRVRTRSTLLAVRGTEFVVRAR